MDQVNVTATGQGARAPSARRIIGSARQRNAGKTSGQVPISTELPLAEWRVRVHASRRRVMLLIRTALWFRQGHSGSHPVRLPRLDDLGFLIPVSLGVDTGSFIRELLRYIATQRQASLISFTFIGFYVDPEFQENISLHHAMIISS